MEVARTGSEDNAPPGSAEQEEPAAFDTIFQMYDGFVWRLLTRLGVGPSDLPDLCQEVFVVVHRRLADFDRSMSMRSWIYGICVRVLWAHRRKWRNRHEVVLEVLPEVPIPAEQDEAYERRRACERLEAILNKLGDEKRAVFVLYELEELTMPEIARALDCPLQTAYSRLHVARAAVSAGFRRFYPQGGFK